MAVVKTLQQDVHRVVKPIIAEVVSEIKERDLPKAAQILQQKNREQSQLQQVAR
jgi:hypothetical protein